MTDAPNPYDIHRDEISSSGEDILPGLEITDYRAALVGVVMANGGHLEVDKQYIEYPELANVHTIRILESFRGKATIRVIPKATCQFEPCGQPQDPRAVITTAPGTVNERSIIVCREHYKAITGETLS